LPEIGYDDVVIASLWDYNDEQAVNKILHRVREGKLSADTFEQKLTRHYNDQTVYFDTDSYLSRFFEPLENFLLKPKKVTEPKHDLVTNSGMIRVAQLLAGQSNAIFNTMASGTGETSERASDTTLSAENWRVSMISSGYIQPVGIVIKYAGKFPSVVPSATISEFGAFDSVASNAGTMFFRTVLPSGAGIEHTQNRTFYSCLESISQVSVT